MKAPASSLLRFLLLLRVLDDGWGICVVVTASTIAAVAGRRGTIRKRLSFRSFIECNGANAVVNRFLGGGVGGGGGITVAGTSKAGEASETVEAFDPVDVIVASENDNLGCLYLISISCFFIFFRLRSFSISIT